jgi:hypothetical protein
MSPTHGLLAIACSHILWYSLQPVCMSSNIQSSSLITTHASAVASSDCAHLAAPHADACAPTSMPRDALFGLHAFDANCWAYGRCNFYNASLSIANYDYNCDTRNNLQGSLYSYLSGTNSQFNITGNSASSAAAGLSVVLAMLLALLQLLL